MASRTILFGFAAAFSCLELLEPATTTEIHASHSHSRFAWLMGVAVVLAVPIISFGLTLLLLVSHVRALETTDAAGWDAGRRRFLVGRLAKATQLTAVAALLAGAVVQLVASGYLGADDVWWVHTKK